MPRASTELTEMLAGDALLCVRRRAAAAVVPARTAAETATAAPIAPAADIDLTCVIDAWPDLPRHIRAAILAMIRETGGDEDRS
jgi:hypothetical protein